jgi:hypothetical protein
LLLALLLFNWFGYRILTFVLEDNADSQLKTSLQNNEFDESQLISIKIPVSYLLCYSIPIAFERVDGKLQIQGSEYRYIKRRIQKDSLELLCIPNPALTKLKAASIEIFRFVNDLNPNESGKSNNSHRGSSKSFSLDYYTLNSPFHLIEPGIAVAATHAHYHSGISSRWHIVAEQPPEIG